MTKVEDVTLPDIGDFTDVEIIEILVAPGDRIEPEQSLLTLESDKATMEVPAPRGGIIGELKVKIGDRVGAGDLLLTLVRRESRHERTPKQRRLLRPLHPPRMRGPEATASRRSRCTCRTLGTSPTSP